MQIDWIRRLQGMWFGCPPTRAGDLFEVQHPWNAFKIGRARTRRSIKLHPLESGDMVLVLQGRTFMDLVRCSVNGDIFHIERIDLWENARLVG